MKPRAVISHDKYYSQFYNLSVNWYNNKHLSMIKQFFFVLNRMNEFMDFRLQYFTTCLKEFC
jgi:hypothetical protein